MTGYYPLLTQRAADLRSANTHMRMHYFVAGLSFLIATVLASYSSLYGLPALTQFYFIPFFLIASRLAKTLTAYHHLQGCLQPPRISHTYRYFHSLSTCSFGLAFGLCLLLYALTMPAILPFISVPFLSFLQTFQLASFSVSLFFTTITTLYLCSDFRRDRHANLSLKNINYNNTLEKKGLFKNYLPLFDPIHPVDASTLSDLLNQRALSTYPLEIALGFADLCIFKECYQYHKKSDPDFENSCRHVLLITSDVLKASKTWNPALSPSHINILIQIRNFIAAQKPFVISLSFDTTSYVYDQKELNRFPSLSSTLAHIPLSSNSQTPYLNKQKLQKRRQQFLSLRPLPSQTSSHFSFNNHGVTRKLLKEGFAYLSTVLPTFSSASLTPAFTILKKRTALKLVSSDPMSRQMQGHLAYIFVKIAKYATLFQDPLSASISLNHPGRPIPLQRKKVTSNNPGSFSLKMYLGITLVARSLNCIQITEDFLNALSKLLPTNQGFHKVYADVRKICLDLENNIFKHINQMSTGSTLPRFLFLHGGRKNRPYDIVQKNGAFSNLFTISVSKNTPPTKCSSFTQECDIIQRALQQCPSPKLTHLDKPSYHTFSSNNYTITDSIIHIMSIWNQLETPRLPYWYHCTKYPNAISILNTQTVEVRHQCYSGAFLSTSIESMYGDITFAFSQETAIMSNIYNTPNTCDHAVWHGCAEPIKLIPHLVAIGYPSSSLSNFIATLKKTGEVTFTLEGAPLYYQRQNHRVFLLTNAELSSLRSLLLKSQVNQLPHGKEPATSNSKPPKTFPLPRYLVENTLYGQKGSTPDLLNPLKSQIYNCTQVLR